MKKKENQLGAFFSDAVTTLLVDSGSGMQGGLQESAFAAYKEGGPRIWRLVGGGDPMWTPLEFDLFFSLLFMINWTCSGYVLWQKSHYLELQNVNLPLNISHGELGMWLRGRVLA